MMHLKLCQMCGANQIFYESISICFLRMHVWDSLMDDGWIHVLCEIVKIVVTFLGFLVVSCLFSHTWIWLGFLLN